MRKNIVWDDDVILDEKERDLEQLEYLLFVHTLVCGLMKKVKSFKPTDKFVPSEEYPFSYHAVAENGLFYVCVGDDGNSLTVKLMQKRSCSKMDPEKTIQLQKKYYEKYKSTIFEVLRDYEIVIRNDDLRTEAYYARYENKKGSTV